MKSEEVQILLEKCIPGIVISVDSNRSIVFKNYGFNELPASSPARGVLIDACDAVLQSGKAQQVELEWQSESGTRWFSGMVLPEIGPKGEIKSVTANCLEITERKRSEDRRHQLRAIPVDSLGNALLGVWEWDALRDTVSWSDELYRIHGVKREDFTPTFANYLSRTHPDDVKSVTDVMNMLRTNPKAFSYNERIIRPSGEIRYLRTWGVPTFTRSGKIEFVSGVCLDNTLKKKQEETVNKSLSLLRATLESTADGILVVDSEGKIAAYNHKFLELWGIPDSVIETRDDKKVIEFILGQLINPEGFLSKVRELYGNPLAESHDILQFRDGRVMERYSRPQNVDHTNVGRVWSFRDVTEYRKSEERVRNQAAQAKFLGDASRTFSEARLNLELILSNAARLVAEFLKDGCLVRVMSKDEGRVEPIAFHHANPEAHRIAGSVLSGTSTLMNQAVTGEVIRSGKAVLTPVVTPELARSLIDQKYWPYLEKFPIHSWIVVPLRIAGKVTGVIIVLRDGTKTPFNENDLQLVENLAARACLAIDNANLYAEAQRAIQVREDFIAIASHELKTPLTPLKLQLQLITNFIKSGIIEIPPKAQGILKLIEVSDRQIMRLTRLIDDLLDVSRITSGRLQLNLDTVNLSELVSSVLNQFNLEISGANCSVELQTEPQVVGNWDGPRVEQIVVNLLTNALKYGDGKPIKIAVTKTDTHGVFTIQDFGIGIDPQNHDRIFQRFERAVSVKHFGGFGMGLYITHQIVEAHGGRITLKSAEGEGSTFRIELPLSTPFKETSR